MGSCASSLPITRDDHHNYSSSHNRTDVVDESRHRKLKDFIPAASVLASQLGSTDESFFDAQPWIESDCDEDFFSIDGDCTPSPAIPTIHRRFSTGTPLSQTPSNSNIFPNLKKVNSTPSRTNITPLHIIFSTKSTPPQSNEQAAETTSSSRDDKRLKLLELFRLSRGGFADEHLLGYTKSIDTKTTGSVCSSKRASNVSGKSSRRSFKAVHPIDCLRKLSTRRRCKNEKKINAEAVGKQGQ